MGTYRIGVAGLGVMGRNLALNIAGRGYSTVVYNRTESRTEAFLGEEIVRGKDILGVFSPDEMVRALERPRKILLMVPSGAVDEMLRGFVPYLEPGDIVIDGGNSHFRETERRFEELQGSGIHFMGMGISGGELGALEGPCLMPGGDPAAYEEVEEILLSISARVKDFHCCGYIGPRGAGHFLKMVHNGIEYGIMQCIAEAYDFMRRSMNFKPVEIAEVFGKWNEGYGESYLLKIASDILRITDRETGSPLVDVILDRALQKGTGQWVSREAVDLGVPVSVIDAAVSSRILSSYLEERREASKVLFGPSLVFKGDEGTMIRAMEDSLILTMLISYVQGFHLLMRSSKEYGYRFDLEEIARIWQGGCIIRASMLEAIRESFARTGNEPFLFFDEEFRKVFNRKQGNWRLRVIESLYTGIPCPSTSAALQYYESFRTARLPANLIQAQRDYFGSHSYERTDREGVFHTLWPLEVEELNKAALLNQSSEA